MRSCRKLLIIRTDRMGDLLMSLPAIQALRRAMPQTKIHLLMRTELLPLLKEIPGPDRLHGLEPGQDRGWRQVIRAALWMRREGFDAVLVMNPSKCFHAASFLAGVPVRAGYRRKLGFLLNRSITDTKNQRNLQESQYNFELARLLQVPISEQPLEMPVSREAEDKVRQLLNEVGIPPNEAPIAIHPWTSNPEKSWPLERFRQTAQELRRAGRSVVLIGLPPENGASVLEGPINLSGRTPLEILPAFLKRCSLLLSNDSGPVHVATAVGTPTVVVASRQHAGQMERWKPLGSIHRTLIDPSVEEALACVKNQMEAAKRS